MDFFFLTTSFTPLVFRVLFPLTRGDGTGGTGMRRGAAKTDGLASALYSLSLKYETNRVFYREYTAKSCRSQDNV